MTQAAESPAIVRKAYRVLGTTDEVTECGLCGRVDLKGTVVLGALDDEGNVEDEVYYGSDCGARAAGWTVKVIRDLAKAADRAAREAAQAERYRRNREWGQARDAWITTNVGPDALDYPRRYGFDSPLKVIRFYMETTGIGWPK